MMVNILKFTLGDKLYTTPINGNASTLPSPEQLKYKILIKVGTNIYSYSVLLASTLATFIIIQCAANFDCYEKRHVMFLD